MTPGTREGVEDTRVSQQCGERKDSAGEGAVAQAPHMGTGRSGVGSPQSWTNQDDRSPQSALLWEHFSSGAAEDGGTLCISQLHHLSSWEPSGAQPPRAQGQEMTVHPNLNNQRMGLGTRASNFLVDGEVLPGNCEVQQASECARASPLASSLSPQGDAEAREQGLNVVGGPGQRRRGDRACACWGQGLYSIPEATKTRPDDSCVFS